MQLTEEPCKYYFKPKEECMRMTAILQNQGVLGYHVRMDGKRRTCLGILSGCYFRPSARPTLKDAIPQEAVQSAQEVPEQQTTPLDMLIMVLASIDRKYAGKTIFQQLAGEDEKCGVVGYIIDYGNFKFIRKLPKIEGNESN